MKRNFFYKFTLFSFQTVNKVLIVYADVVKQDFEKYTNDHKKVSPQSKYILFNIKRKKIFEKLKQLSWPCPFFL